MTLQNPVSEVLASSCDLSSTDSEILLSNDDNFIIVKSQGKVSAYAIKTGRHVSDLFGDEVDILAIWKADLEDEWLYGLTRQSILKWHVPNAGDGSRTPLPEYVKFPDDLHTVKVAQRPENGQAERLYFVSKKPDGHYILKASSLAKKDVYKYGQVNVTKGKALFAFNASIVAKCGLAVQGQLEGKLAITSTCGKKHWNQTMAQDRPVCMLACHPSDNVVAVADMSGRIRVFRAQEGFKFFASDVHWHSLPVEALRFTPDGVHLLSGGGEGVVLKWDAKSLRRVAVVPRIGSVISNLASSYKTVVASTQANSLKVFTSQLEDDQMIVGLTKRLPDKMFWHQATQCLVLAGGNQHIQFFDPVERTQKFAVDVIGQNVVLGERDVPVALSQVALYALSGCGQWLAVVEQHWDRGHSLKFWDFSHNKFDLNTKINDAHEGDITNVQFVTLAGHGSSSLGLVSCGQDAKAKLWQLNYETSHWELLRTFTHHDSQATCAASSRDGSVLAIAFASTLTLWDTYALSLLTTLGVGGSAKELLYSSIAFGHGVQSQTLLATTQSNVQAWDLLSNQLKCQLPLDNPKLLLTSGKQLSIMYGQGTISKLDNQTLKPQVVASKDYFKAVTFSPTGDKLYGIIGHNDHFSLNCLSLKGKTTLTATQASEKESSVTALFTSTGLKATVEPDIFYAREGPTITPDMIADKMSLSSTSILKRALPI